MRRFYCGRTDLTSERTDMSRVARELRAVLNINNWDPDSFAVRQMRRPPDMLAGLFFFSLEESSEKAVREGIRAREYLRRIGFRFELARNQQGAPQASRVPRSECRWSEDVDDIPSNVNDTIAPSKDVDAVTTPSDEILHDDVSSGENSTPEFFTGFWTIFQFDKEDLMEVRRSVGKLRQLYRRAHVTDCILRQGNDGFVGFLLDSVTKSRRLCWTADPYLQLVATEVDETPTTDHATAKELIRKFRRQEGAPDDEFKIPESIFVKFWTNNRRYPCPDEVPLQDVRLVRLEPCSFTVLLPQSVAQELFSGRSLLRLRKRRLVPEVDSESHGYDTRRIRHALRTRYQ